MADVTDLSKRRREQSANLSCPECGGEWLKLIGSVVIDRAAMRVTGWQGVISCPDHPGVEIDRTPGAKGGPCAACGGDGCSACSGTGSEVR
jgi:hypothetical protein